MMNEPDQHFRPSKMEAAKRLKAVKDIAASKEDYEAIRRRVISEDEVEAVEKAIQGLSEEDEFALMCRLMGTATHMVRLDQNPIFKGDFIVPDFLARFQPGCFVGGKTSVDSAGYRCMIEVKSTNKEKYKIGGSELRRRRNFAKEFGLPLLIAVRFLGFPQSAWWVIVDGSDESMTSISVSPKDILHGIRHILWDEYIYMAPIGVEFRAVHDATADGFGWEHRDYGPVRELQIHYDSNIIRLKGSEAVIVGMFFRGFSLETISTERNGNVTICTMVPRQLFATVVDMIRGFNSIPTDGMAETDYNPSRILALMDQNEPTGLLSRDALDGIEGWLLAHGLLKIFSIGEVEDHVAKWLEYGGK